MFDLTLRRVIYRCTVTDDDGTYDLIVTRERNGSGVFLLDLDKPPVLDAWFFCPREAVDHVLGHRIAHRPQPGVDLRWPDSSAKSKDELKRVVYERELRGERTLVVTREINGYLLSLFAKADNRVLVYGLHPDPTSAIDDLVKRTRHIY